MSSRLDNCLTVKTLGLAATALAVLAGPNAALASGTSYSVGPVRNVSASCSGQNAEVEQAVDRPLGFVYEVWMGCRGIAFARSRDGGRRFDTPMSVPGSVGSNVNVWDPAVAVAPDGAVYAVFMIAKAGKWYPVVAASFDHGESFAQVSSLLPPDVKNWGDRPFIAVGPDGTVYVTWDYGPERSSVTYLCATNGSCAFATGDLNVVIQRSTDRGATWSPMSYVSPGFPASGGDSAPIVVEASGRLDVLYQGYRITNTTTYTMKPARSYFTSSTDRGISWSRPVAVGPHAGTMSLAEWWIDGDIALDSGGNVYATWDTQGRNADGSRKDVGWLSYSSDHGRTWSVPVQVPAERLRVPHMIQVTGGAPGIAFVGWLSDSDNRGYAEYLRAFSIKKGWLSQPLRVSTGFGASSVWPGDTFGISSLSANELALSWGSAIPSLGKKSAIFAAHVSVLPG